MRVVIVEGSAQAAEIARALRRAAHDVADADVVAVAAPWLPGDGAARVIKDRQGVRRTIGADELSRLREGATVVVA